MQQFRRDARVTIGVGETALVISGLRVRFECVKDQLSNLVPNQLTLTIYNLSKSSRERISEFGETVTFEVGYGGVLRRLFIGKIMHVIHEHEDTEWLSTLYCWDLNAVSIAEQSIQLTILDGTTVKDAVKRTASFFGSAAEGFKDESFIGFDEIGSRTFLNTISKTGPTARAMDELARDYGFDWLWNDSDIEVRGKGTNASFSDDAVVISASTGMVGSPVLTDLGVEVTTLLNPAIRVWRKITIESVGAGVRVGQLLTREIIPTLHEGTYIVGQVIFVGDTWSNDWLSKVKTFRDSIGAI